MSWSVSFSPVLPLPIIVAAAALAFIVICVLAWSRHRATLLRGAAFALLVLALLNPVVTETERTRLPGIAAIIVDETESQEIAKRDKIVEDARKALSERLAGFEEIEFRWVTVGGANVSSDGTELFTALNRAFSDVPPDRIAGAVLVTDGQVHDIPASAEAIGFSAPVHVLLTARPSERDRRVVTRRAPRFSLVGKTQTIAVRVEDKGAVTARPGRQQVQLTIHHDGEVIGTRTVETGLDVELPVKITHGGKNIFEIETEALDGELTETNNRAVVSIEGVRENLRVLLVSGEPHAGERTWRNLLKSDAAVDLVHFTILRPPEKQDGTPISQLSLIALPTRELFSVKIDEFDLIILDRYQRRGVLPIIYFDNIARYVREGGALLVAAGPEMAQSVSIYRSPLAPVLPAKPSGKVFEQPYRALVSDRGARHPVTRDLPGGDLKDPQWGRWFRAIDAAADRGDVVMSGPENSPLLVLSREEEGRVALLLSDHAWLWSRGYEGGGPHIALLRRLSHWLMKEPELEEERLTGTSSGGKLVIERQTMGETAGPVRVTGPTGEERTVELKQAGPGQWRGELEARQTGLYRLAEGDLSALTAVGEINPRETAELIATADKIAPVIGETGGGIARLDADNVAASLPRISLLGRAQRWSGNGWIALRKSQAYQIDGIRTVPLMAGLIALAVLLAALGGLWYREGR